jgi:outer membrane protein assembly factor BamB
LSARAVWTASTPRTKFSSASVVGDHLYGIDEGTLVCARLSDGERVWRAGRYGYGPHLLCGEDLLLIQTEPGPVVLVRASAEGLQELAKLPALSDKTWNPPALAGRWLLVRNDREAVCWELPAGP